MPESFVSMPSSAFTISAARKTAARYDEKETDT